MKKIAPRKLKIMMIVFLVTGAWGIVLGNFIVKYPYVTILGVINLVLGAFVGYLYLNPKTEKNNPY